VPAVLGGMIISVVDRDGTVINSRVNFPDTIDFVVMIPDFKLSTEEARLALPEEYSIKESVFNLSRTALLVNSLNNGELENLRAAIDDKLHQPFRASLIEGADKIFAKSKELGALGEFISGAGPTLISLINKGDKKFIEDMRSFLNTMNNNWDLKVINLCMDGTSTEVVE
jgi:homoserine kinase